MRKMLALGPAVGRNDASRIESICAEALEADPRDFMALFSPAETVSRILAPFTWIAKVRRLNESARKDEAESKTSYAEWAQWAKGYVSWYEARSRSAP